MLKNGLWPLGVLLGVVGTLTVTGLCLAGRLGGQPLGRDASAALVLPAEYAFSIWGVIYSGLLLYAGYQALPGQWANPRLRTAAPWVLANCGLNALWLPLAYHGYELLPLGLLFGYLVTLVGVSGALQVGTAAVSPAETWLARVPFGLYFGWITAACAVATAQWLKHRGVGPLGLGEPAWAVLLLLATGGVGLTTYRSFPNRAYLLVVAWAGVGVAAAAPPWMVQVAAGGVTLVALIYALLPR